MGSRRVCVSTTVPLNPGSFGNRSSTQLTAKPKPNQRLRFNPANRHTQAPSQNAFNQPYQPQTTNPHARSCACTSCTSNCNTSYNFASCPVSKLSGRSLCTCQLDQHRLLVRLLVQLHPHQLKPPIPRHLQQSLNRHCVIARADR